MSPAIGPLLSVVIVALPALLFALKLRMPPSLTIVAFPAVGASLMPTRPKFKLALLLVIVAFAAVLVSKKPVEDRPELLIVAFAAVLAPKKFVDANWLRLLIVAVPALLDELNEVEDANMFGPPLLLMVAAPAVLESKKSTRAPFVITALAALLVLAKDNLVRPVFIIVALPAVLPLTKDKLNAGINWNVGGVVELLMMPRPLTVNVAVLTPSPLNVTSLSG